MFIEWLQENGKLCIFSSSVFFVLGEWPVQLHPFASMVKLLLHFFRSRPTLIFDLGDLSRTILFFYPRFWQYVHSCSYEENMWLKLCHTVPSFLLFPGIFWFLLYRCSLSNICLDRPQYQCFYCAILWCLDSKLFLLFSLFFPLLLLQHHHSLIALYLIIWAGFLKHHLLDDRSIHLKHTFARISDDVTHFLFETDIVMLSDLP